ncbi:MAG: hypothetical protein J2P21_32075 [Chloracidobacterium sp.]|nr:hypothetical protein [Chloracidobacterium sp.]
MQTRKPPRDWMWKRLAETASPRAFPTWRRPDYLINRFGEQMRFQCEYPRSEAIDRFNGDDSPRPDRRGLLYRLHDGKRFRVDDDLVTTPARFIYQALSGQKPPESEYLFRACSTPRCCRLSHMERRKWLK